MPTVSVVIPLFNGARFIAEAIQSVFAQSRPPLEILVVDDGSTDESARILQVTQGPVPVHYYKQTNQGTAAARNLGAQAARGEWLSFLDQDDIWHPDKLRIQIDYIGLMPQVQLFCSAFECIDEKGCSIPVPRAITKPNPLFQNQAVALPSTVLIRKDVFLEAGGFNPVIRLGEDALFYLIARDYPVHRIPQPLVKYRRHRQQTSKSKQVWEETYPLFHQAALEVFRQHPRQQAILAQKTASVYTDLGRYRIRSGDYGRARQWFRKSYAMWPWSWTNFRLWGLSLLPGLRDWYRIRKTRRKEH